VVKLSNDEPVQNILPSPPCSNVSCTNTESSCSSDIELVPLVYWSYNMTKHFDIHHSNVESQNWVTDEEKYIVLKKL
jgi:predicted double-glycine peptidase